MKTTLLITRDRPLFNQLVREEIRGVQLTYTDSLESAEGLCELRPVASLIIDADTIPFDSLSFFRRCRKTMPSTKVYLIHSDPLAVELLSELEELLVTAVTKPVVLSEILRAVTKPKAAEPVATVRSDEDLLVDIMGGSPAMEKIARLLVKVAPSSATILLGGENGTGKEYFATIIHKLSKLDGKFVPVNCGAIPETLFESELFGHKKGSFTGADQDRLGLVQEADGGTLFLDEIGELTLPMQVKLLRFLQEEKFKPVGESSERTASCRVIAATNRDLKKMVEAGAFREDLFYRIHVFPITLPPLRERKEMIPRLVELFLHTFSRKQKKSLTGFTPEAEFLLSRHRYPGNIRELQNIIEYATILANPPTITVHDLPDYLQAIPGITDQRLPALTIGWELNESAERVREGFFVGEDITLESMELRYMQYILEKCGDNHSEAARILGISRSTLWRKLKGESHEQS